MALGITLVLAVVLTTVITFTASGARDSNRVNAGQKAYALAEAGVNNALAVLNANYPDATVPYPGKRCLLGQKPAPAGFPGTEPIGTYTCAVGVPLEYASTPDPTRPLEQVHWWGRIRSVAGLGLAWVISSTGSVPNPTGPGTAPVTRTVYAKVPVIIGSAQSVPPGVLNWLYSVKDADLAQAVEIRSPLYVRGNLRLGSGVDMYGPLYVTCVVPPAALPTTASPCPSTAGNVLMENTAKFYQPSTIAIGGALEQTSNQNTVGTSGSRLSKAAIVKSCKKKANPVNNPCKWDADDVYVDATGAASTTSNGTNRNNTMPVDPVPLPPVIDYSFWYQYSSPGPQFPCDVSSGTPPLFDTGDGLLNVSVPGIINLTPATSYSCETLAGEITWDVPTRTLTIKGTIYIDGSAEIESTFPGQSALLYQGQGTIYLSGTFALKNTKMCAVIDGSGNNCNVAVGVWDPNVSALILVAQSRGSDLPSSKQSASGNNSVEVVSSQFQGALFGKYDVSSTTTSVVQGPMISTDASIILRNTSGPTFPSIYFAPSGAPGNPPPPSELLAPREFGGG